MLIGFNGATAMKKSLISDIKSASKAGFDVIEIWKSKLFKLMKERDLSQIKRFFSTCNIFPYSINSIEQATFSKDYKEKLDECETLCGIASDLGIKVIIIVPGLIDEPLPFVEIKKESVGILKEFGKIALKKGIKLSFEFLAFSNCSVNKLNDAIEIVESTDLDNIGITVDSFHLFVGNSNVEDIRRLDRKKLYIVHINDIPKIKDRKPKDSDRIMPGDGVLPLKSLLSELKSIGYNGVISIELFNPVYWEWDENELATMAYERMKSIF